MIEQDYVDFCNLAFDLVSKAENHFDRMGDEELRQLRYLVEIEANCCADGKVAPGYDFVRSVLEADVNERGKTADRRVA